MLRGEKEAVNSSTPFDLIANGYDRDFSRNPIGAWMRLRVHEVFDRYFFSPGRLWDVGCGTGEDAIRMARKGFTIIASDSSTQMLGELTRKSTDAGLASSITIQYDPEGSATPGLGLLAADEAFDGIYSNFGPFNCFKEPAEFASLCGKLLPKDRFLILIYMGRFSPAETGYFLLKGRAGEAIRRWSTRVQPGSVGQSTIPILYYSVGQIRRLFSPWFDLVETVPLGIIAPPPFVVSLPPRHPGLLSLLFRLDARLSHCRVLADWGDHTIAVLRRL
jgi:SAM-dependent methyltransferase